MHQYKELHIWKKSIELAKEVYTLTQHFPKEEIYGMVSQMRRAAVSISSNIAEGAGRNSDKEFAYFLSMPQGSAYELESQFEIAGQLGWLKQETKESGIRLIQEIQKMNYTLIQKLKQAKSLNTQY